MFSQGLAHENLCLKPEYGFFSDLENIKNGLFYGLKTNPEFWFSAHNSTIQQIFMHLPTAFL